MKLTAKCVANVWCLFEGEALIAIVRGDDQDVDYEQKARRITACVNACAGIPTETLEAGVVVVPVEELRKRLPALIRATAEMVLSERRKLDNDQLDEELKDLSALSQTTAKMESKLGGFIEWLSRLHRTHRESWFEVPEEVPEDA